MKPGTLINWKVGYKVFFKNGKIDSGIQQLASEFTAY